MGKYGKKYGKIFPKLSQLEQINKINSLYHLSDHKEEVTIKKKLRGSAKFVCTAKEDPVASGPLFALPN